MSVEAMDPAQEFEANLIARLKPVHEVTALGNSDVQQFYSGATVFLTGGSGFLGKQLIEKLLRATKVSKIFFLLRSKKGKTMEQRLNEMLQDPVYDLLREQQPDFAEKLVPVSGDVAELRLGLSDEDWNTITEQVDIVFHLAATTKLDESLRVATLINLRGTRETLTLSKACKNLRSYVYVSTAYSQARKDLINTTVYEKFYKSPVPPDVMISIAETVDEERIKDITQGLMKNWRNTYIFAKSIAEELVNSMGNELPTCVIRPAVVYGSKLEPNPGWVDTSCLYGFSGLILALNSLGIMHTLNADMTKLAALVPVDYVSNVTIAAARETARKRAAGDNETKIYTVSPTARNPVTWGEVYGIMEVDGRNYPTPMAVGYPFAWYTKSPVLFWLYSWLLHLIPAYIADGITVMLGNKRRFTKQAKKMHKLLTTLSFFCCNQWNFDDQNTATLYNSLSKADRVIFNFDIQNIDYKEYVMTGFIGLRKYLVKDGLTGTVYARKKQKVFKILTFIILPLYFYFLFRVLYFILSVLTLYW